jgi:hypothetical protein
MKAVHVNQPPATVLENKLVSQTGIVDKYKRGRKPGKK